jgi:hypothetical protein
MKFYHPFGRLLDPDNRWIVISEIIPWEKLEDQYAPEFSRTIGAPALPGEDMGCAGLRDATRSAWDVLKD